MSEVGWCSLFFFFKQKTAYEMRISDWSSDVCSSDLGRGCYHDTIRQRLFDHGARYEDPPERAASRMTGAAVPAAFLDRDGVINIDRGYVHRIEDFELLPGVINALKTLRDSGYLLVVVTNQSGIARGYFTEADFQALTEHMRLLLGRHDVELAGVFHCPHLPHGSVAEYRRDCTCRKPMPGMFTKAIEELHIDPARSILVGDKPSDIAAGHAAGIGHCFLVGGHRSEEHTCELQSL